MTEVEPHGMSLKAQETGSIPPDLCIVSILVIRCPREQRGTRPPPFEFNRLSGPSWGSGGGTLKRFWKP